jgi:hypothetical protein
MAADKLTTRIDGYIKAYGVEGLNKVIERHELAEEKRNWFSIRFAVEDEEMKEKCTAEMEKLTARIDEIDFELEKVYGVPSTKRPQIVKDLKKYQPNGWSSGFFLKG